MNYFDELYDIILEDNVDKKENSLESLVAALQQEKCIIDHTKTSQVVTTPSYAKSATIVAPQKVPVRKKLSTLQGRRYLVHAIMHIEYSAIDLALDAAYRYKNMPNEFYIDWLEVAQDEIRHFRMLQSIAAQLDLNYLDIAVHTALFEAGAKTAHSLEERMAVIPRFMEANGLDAHALLIARLKPFENEPLIKDLIRTLDIIHHEEIDHVKKGNKWFKYAAQTDCEVRYFEIINAYFPNSFPRKQPPQISARKEAGFSCKELKIIANITC